MKGALKMKHKIVVLGLVISCLLSLTGCGEETKYNTLEGSSRYYPDLFTNEQIRNYANYVEDELFEQWYLGGVTPENFEERAYFPLAMKVNQSTGELEFDDEYFSVNQSGYESWYKALNELGFTSPDTLQSDLKVTDTRYYINKDDELVVEATVEGTKHSALMEIYLGNDFKPTDLGVTVNKTTGEKLENAGLNTLLGMGMAFTVLIIISLIISLFPTLFGGGRKKKESDKEIAEKAMDNTISQIAEQEDLSNDAELVAVIAAAIAAYEGSGSTDGFRVRSIRKVNTNWKK